MKASGWANWKTRYWDHQGSRWVRVVRRDTRDPFTIKSQAEFNEWAENDSAPIQRYLWENEILAYTNTGNVAARRSKVESAAAALVEDSKPVGRDQAIGLEEEIHYYETKVKKAGAARGAIHRNAAERLLNQDRADRAKAILVAAKLANIRLTEAQRKRLKEISEGKFMELVYRRYTSGDLLGIKPRKGGRTTNAADLARIEELRSYQIDENRRRAGLDRRMG